MVRQWPASGRRGQPVDGCATPPVGGLATSRRGRQLVREIGCQRLLHAATDGQAVKNGRVAAAVGAFQKIAKRVDLGLKACRSGGRLALVRHGDIGCGLGLAKRRFGVRQRVGGLLRVCLGARQRGGGFVRGGVKLLQRNLGKRGVGGGDAAFKVGDASRQRLACAGGRPHLAGGIRQRGIGLVRLFANGGQRGQRGLALRRGIVDPHLKFSTFRLKPVHGTGSVAAKAFLARDILGHLRLLRHHPVDGVANAGFLAVKLVAADGKPLIFGGACNLGLAKRRQRGRLFGADRRAAGGCLGSLDGKRPCGAKPVVTFGKRALGSPPARHKKLRLRLANAVGDGPVAGCLACLLAERLALLDKAGNDIIQTFQIGLGAAKPQFRLVPAGMKPADIGGLLQKRAPVSRAGPDDGADPPLRDDAG